MADLPALLLVEDEPLIQLLLGEGLTDGGFDVTIASSGQTALEKLDAQAARFHAVVTDIKLGSGPSGWDVGRRARELVPAMPVVYMTGDSAADWSNFGVASSIVLLKPLGIAQVEAAVASLLSKAAQGQAKHS